ncbi:hypothetical protein [Nocardia thraciensis]
MTGFNVAPAVYYSSATALNQAAQHFYAAFVTQMNAMSGTAGMGGSVGACKAWSTSYDTAAPDAYLLAGQLADAIHNYAGILQQAGHNYARADHDPKSGRPEPSAPASLPPARSVCPNLPPSAGGPGNGLVDDGFELASKVGIPIPDGDPGKLLTAADAWKALAADVNVANLPAKLEGIAQNFQAVTAPEVQFIDEDIREMKTAAEDLITTFTDLANSCREQKTAIDNLREDLKGLLQDLAKDIATEVATTVVFGAVAGALTVGFGAAAVTAYKTGKIAKKVKTWADRIAGIVQKAKLLTAVKVQKSTSASRQKMQRIIDLVKKHGDDVKKAPGKSSITQKAEQIGKEVGKLPPGSGKPDILAQRLTDLKLPHDDAVEAAQIASRAAFGEVGGTAPAKGGGTVILPLYATQKVVMIVRKDGSVISQKGNVQDFIGP